MVFFTLPKPSLGDLTNSRCELESAASSGIFDQDLFPACGVVRRYRDSSDARDGFAVCTGPANGCATRDRVWWASPLGEEAALGTLIDGGYASRAFFGD
jgi:hypothetical protein